MISVTSLQRLLALILVLTVPGLLHAAGTASPVRHVIWDKTPIPVQLKVNVEKRIEFPDALASVDLPVALRAPVSTLIFTGNTLYWTAHQPWAGDRLIVTTTSGTVYLIDASANEASGDDQPLIVVPQAPAADTGEKATERHYDMVDLVRFAAQHLHGPRRLVKPLPGVERIPVRQQPLPLVRGGTLDARPVAQWHDGRDGWYVTAVAVRNATQRVIALDPLALRGQWRFAAPHQPSVTGRGSLGDTTVWYLVSTAPFDTVTRSLQAPVDMPVNRNGGEAQ
ncbi:MAG TPA: TIGR03749 family integrating conjugative element protein [Gammaproteobacteria bacterium]|nr:TIGR03749 family integrating conjugative element protein [Gammaproteobacteria bacterium]